MLALRPYQQDGVDRIHAALRRVRRVLYALATGGGKTVVAAALILAWLAAGARVLFLAHRRELIKQAFCKLVRAGVPPESIGIILAGVPLPQGELFVDDVMLTDEELWRRHARRRPDAPVQIASVDTLRHRVTWPLADYVLVDECHRALAKTYVAIAGHYGAARIIGLTATPCRTDGRGLGEAFDELVMGPSYMDLVAAGALVAPRVFTVPAASLPDLSAVRVVAGDYNAEQLEQACNTSGLVGDIVEHYLRRGNGAPCFAFAASVTHSRHIAARFREAGVPAAHLDGETPVDERDRILEDLRSGGLRVVANCDVCTEGTDVPIVKTIVCARPTMSVRVFLQQIGRGARPYNGHPFVVLDHAGCATKFLDPDTALPRNEWSLEGRKRRVGASAAPPAKSCPDCYAVVPAACAACPECGYAFGDVPGREVPKERDGELVEMRPLTSDELRAAWDGIVEEWRRDNAKRPAPRKPGWCWYRFQERHHQAPPAGCKLPELTAEQRARRARADELGAQAAERGYAPGFVHARLAAEAPALAAEAHARLVAEAPALARALPPARVTHAVAIAEEWSW